MSILLESLNGTNKGPNGDVPSIDDSHFDDEMLSDEWLLKKLKFWKMFSAVLIAVIFASWSYHFFYSTDLDVDMAHFEQVVKREVEKLRAQDNDSAVENSQPSNHQSSNAPPSENTSLTANQDKASSAVTKSSYQPKKIEIQQSSSQPNVVKSNSTQKQSSENKISAKTSTGILDYESLTNEERQSMPDLDISSYAISDNAKKSFVVLNGSFYGQGETIAPNLVLLSIQKDSIVFRFKEKQIRKKYSQ